MAILTRNPDREREFLVLDVAARTLTRVFGHEAREVVDEIRKLACRRGALVVVHDSTVARDVTTRESAR